METKCENLIELTTSNVTLSAKRNKYLTCRMELMKNFKNLKIMMKFKKLGVTLIRIVKSSIHLQNLTDRKGNSIIVTKMSFKILTTRYFFELM